MSEQRPLLTSLDLAGIGVPIAAAIVWFFAAGGNSPLIVVAAIYLLVAYVAGYAVGRIYFGAGSDTIVLAAVVVVALAGMAYILNDRIRSGLGLIAAPGVGMMVASLIARWSARIRRTNAAD